MFKRTINDYIGKYRDSPLKKKFLYGTHRALEPEQLLSSLKPDFQRFEISRIARITDLDRIGIEVFTTFRPNSRGLSVTQGKGADKASAKLSSIMEAVENWHAERPECRLFLASKTEMTERRPEAPVHFWSDAMSPNKPILWAMATDLATGADSPVPFDLVHANFSIEGRSHNTDFLVTTNGLASGANLPEALTHALCEVIERHATAEFGALSPDERAAHALNLESVDDDLCLTMIGRFADAGIDLCVWETTQGISVPSYLACINDLQDGRMPPGFGAGCHPARDVALSRAITEAAQARLTRISGARDDLAPNFYDAAERARARFIVEGQKVSGPRTFADAPDFSSDCLIEDLSRVTERVIAAGHPNMFAVNLADDPRYSVVRVIVPTLTGLEGEV